MAKKETVIKEKCLGFEEREKKIEFPVPIRHRYATFQTLKKVESRCRTEIWD